MSRTIRHALLTLSCSAMAAVPAFAQSVPPVYATPPATTRPAEVQPSGNDLFQVIADYAEKKAAEARKANDPTAVLGWEQIRKTYRLDDQTAATAKTLRQRQAVIDFRSALLQVSAKKPPMAGILMSHALFLGDLYIDNISTKETAGWYVSKEHFASLHRSICANLATQTDQPSQTTRATSPTHIPVANTAPRPLAADPAWLNSPTYIPLVPTPLPADLQANIDALSKHQQWYDEQKPKWEMRDAERQKKLQANLDAIFAGKPEPYPEVKFYPASMAGTMSLIEDTNKYLDALMNPDKYTEAERARIARRMQGHEHANMVLNADLPRQQLSNTIEQQVQLRQTLRMNEHLRVNPNGPVPTPSSMPSVR